jgi:hypothetical protein
VLLGAVAVLVLGAGCGSEKEPSVPDDQSYSAEETSTDPTTKEKTVVKETTVVVLASAPSPAQAPSPSPEVQQAAGPEPVATEAEIPPDAEISLEPENPPEEVEIPHDGTVVPCFQDPVCSSEQARMQNEFVAEMEAARADGQPPDPNLAAMCRQAAQSGNLPAACRTLGG